ncbi:MAG: hypothetical protein GY801_47975 [bacterium]|nr:hypothetical protein [bacterium]
MKKFITILIIIAALIGTKMLYIDHKAGKDVEAKLQKVGDFVDVTYDKVSVDLLGWKPRMKNVTISQRGSSAVTEIESIVISDFDNDHEIPLFMNVGFEGINMEVNEANFGSQSKELKRLGYEEIQAEMQLNYHYDREKKEFTLKQFRFGADDAGHIQAKFRLSNIDLNPDTLFFLLLTYPKIRINSAEFSYDDDSLLPRLQKYMAQEEGKSVDEIVKEMTESLDREIEKEENAFNKKALKALKKFVKKPNEIKFIIAPKEPVSLEKLQGLPPTKVPDTLNMKIKS